MIDWRQSRVIAGTIVALFFVIQLAVPIVRMYGEPGQRFGWQMYSTVRAAPKFVVDTTDGATEIDLTDYVPKTRVEVDLTSYLPEHLCLVVPEAETVTWDGGSHRC